MLCVGLFRVGLGCGWVGLSPIGLVVPSWVGLPRGRWPSVCQPCGSLAEFEERFLRLAADCPAPDIVALHDAIAANLPPCDGAAFGDQLLDLLIRLHRGRPRRRARGAREQLRAVDARRGLVAVGREGP